MGPVILSPRSAKERGRRERSRTEGPLARKGPEEASPCISGCSSLIWDLSQVLHLGMLLGRDLVRT